MRKLLLAILLLAAEPAVAQNYTVNTTAFPLSGNQVFPARTNRLSLKCVNPTTNGNVTITYGTNFSFVMVPGSALWETTRPPNGQIRATGTAGQTLPCEELY